KIIEKLTNKNLQELISDKEIIDGYLTANGAVMDSAIRFCQEERRLQPQDDARQSLAPRMYPVTFAYDQLGYQILNGFVGAESHPLGSLARFYLLAYKDGRTELPEKSLFTIRTNVEKQLLQIRNLKEILRSYTLQIGGDPSKVEKIFEVEYKTLSDE